MGLCLRLPATLSAEPDVVRAGFWGGIVYRAVLELAKAQGWDGIVDPADLTPALLARHLNGRSDLHSRLGRGLAACLRAGLLVPVEGQWVIPKWRDYQPDPTAADRQRLCRRLKRDDLLRKALEAPSRPVTGVTVSHSDTRESRRRRDVRLQGSDPPPSPPADRGGAAASPSGEDDGGAAGAGCASGPPAASAPATARLQVALEARGVRLGERPLRGGVRPAVWLQHAEPILAEGTTVEVLADAVAAADPGAKPWEVFKRLRGRPRWPTIAPMPLEVAARREEESRGRGAVEAVWGDLLRTDQADRVTRGRDWRAWGLAIASAIEGAVTGKALAEALASAPAASPADLAGLLEAAGGSMAKVG